ncbi:MAG: S9 family peptidase [Tannerellaceae bacterium]|nr:S9 family peptidase [Tannerellaceae bacterium]
MTFKNRYLLLFLLFLFLIPMQMIAQTRLTIHDLIPGGKTYTDFVPATLNQLKWCGNAYIYVEGEEVIGVQPGKTGKVIVSLSELNIAIEEQTKTIHLTKMPVFSVPYEKQAILSFTEKGELFHYDLQEKAIVARYMLPEEGKNYEFSPGSSLIAYTAGNNINILSPNNQVTAVTCETTEHVVCGQAVHQREFGIRKGLFWSPSGTKLAFYRMDESMVTDYPIVNIDTRIAQAEPYKYPMAGMKSHEVTIGIYGLQSGETVWLKTGEPKEKHLTNIGWSPDEKSVYVAELNRGQNECHLVRYEVSTGEREAILFTETKNTYVEPQHPVQFLPADPDKFIWQSERDGFNHIYLYDTTGKLLQQVTSGPWMVTDVLGFDPKGETLFYRSTAARPDDPSGNVTALENHTWKVNLKSGKQACLTPKPGVHQVLLSPDRKYALDLFSSPSIPREIDLLDLKTHQPTVLFQAEDPYKAYTLPDIEVGQIKAADGVTDLNYRLVKPVELDESKTYPVIMYVYGGPHSRLISNSWQYGTRGWDLYMAQQGVIVFTLDGRGSANRGHAFESAIFRNLGVHEMADQMQGVDFLKSLPYVGPDRIGVHGWSYGGFMTTNLMLTYPDIFKVGVAGGPVIDWSQYEIMYGERYMDHPDDNPDGYTNANLKLKAGNLKGRLLLIHGDVDPVVVWQHSLGFLKACIEADTYPDYFVYPRHPHNVTGKDRPHLYEKITRYFTDYL